MTNYNTRIENPEENVKLENVMMFIDKIIFFGVVSPTLSAFVVRELSKNKIPVSNDLLFNKLVLSIDSKNKGFLNCFRIAKRHAWLNYKQLSVLCLFKYETLLMLKDNEVVAKNIKLLKMVGCNILSDWSKTHEKKKVQLFLYALSDVFDDFKYSNKESEINEIEYCLGKINKMKNYFINDFFNKAPYDEYEMKFDILMIWDIFLNLLAKNICSGGIYHEVFKDAVILSYAEHLKKQKESEVNINIDKDVIDLLKSGNIKINNQNIENVEELNSFVKEEYAKNKILEKNSTLLNLISKSNVL